MRTVLDEINYLQARIADSKKGQPITTSTLKEIASEYNLFPKEFHGIKKGSLVFIMKHGDLDAVMKGIGVLARVSFEKLFDKTVMVVKSDKALPEGHVFVGLPRLKGYANAYVHASQGGVIILGSMSSALLDSKDLPDLNEKPDARGVF